MGRATGWSLHLVTLLVGSAGVLGHTPPPAKPEPQSEARHLIWRVSKGDHPVAFLVGSVHVLTKDSYPLPAIYEDVYRQTAVLVEEVDMGDIGSPAAILATAASAVFADGQTLKTVLDAPTYERVAAKAVAAGLPMPIVDRMKPWLVATTLSVPELQRSGFDPGLGLDRHFYSRAKSDSKVVRGLETAAYQIERLNGLSMPVQLDMLRALLNDVDAQLSAVREIVAGWRSGDVAALERLLLKEFQAAPEVYQRLLVERNRNWIPAIAECLPGAPCMVVVGGAHLLGPDSLVALLKEAGFTVQQM